MKDFHSYVSLDLETTGLEPEICDIIEVAMVKVRNGEIVDRLESFVFTPLEISEHVSYLTGIHKSDIENAPDFIELKQKIEDFIGDDPLMGHNIWFDWNFLTQKGVQLENNELWDTYIMSNILYPELPSHSLETNTKYFGIEHEDSHRAMADVMACYELWKILMDTFPELDDKQKEKLKQLSGKTEWPLMDFFLQEKASNKHELHLPKGQQSIALLQESPQLENNDFQLVHCVGRNPVAVAKALGDEKKTLYIAGYEHTRKDMVTLIDGAVELHAPYSYLDHQKLDELWGRDTLEAPEATILLKTILDPDAISQDALSLSHPERPVWRELQTQSTNQDPENAYQKAYASTCQQSKVVTSHAHILHDLEYISHFERLVILEPQMMEDNASRAFGNLLNKEQWLGMGEDEQWVKQGELFFAQLEQLGQSLVPSSQYPEHIVLSENIVNSNEFIRLKSAIQEVVEVTEDAEKQAYLKYFQAFFHTNDPSWMRWITVHPRRGVMIQVMPLSVKALLKKHILDKIETIVVSNTSASFPSLPDGEVIEFSKKTSQKIILPDLQEITGTKQQGDQKAQIDYLVSQLPNLQGNTAVVFTSKTALKKYFFQVAKVLSDKLYLLGEDISGGTGKLKDRYSTSDAQQKVLFVTYRNLRLFAPQMLDFDNIIIQGIPFDPPGLPSHQLRSAQYANGFMDYALPRARQNLLEILASFTQRDDERRLIVLDRRAQEKRYAQDLVEDLQNI